MGLKLTDKQRDWVWSVILTVMFIYGGLGRVSFMPTVVIMGTALGLVILATKLKGGWWLGIAVASVLIAGGFGLAGIWAGLVWWKRRQWQIPKALLGLSGFMLLVWVHSLLVPAEPTGQEWLVLYTGGMAWWWLTSMEPKLWQTRINRAVVMTGMIIVGLYGLYRINITPLPLGMTGMVIEDSFYLNHYHFGDWWMMFGVMAGVGLVAKRGWWRAIVTLLVLGVIYWSQSRSALVGLAAGWLYLMKDEKIIRRWWWLGLTVVYLGLAVKKNMLGSRMYYLQALIGLWRYPLGMGLGRFGELSKSWSEGSWLFGYSSITQSLVLEWVSAFGWLGWSFSVWLGKMVMMVWGDDSPERKMARAVWLALTVNLCLNSTYIIPSFVWVWAMWLGLARPAYRN